MLSSPWFASYSLDPQVPSSFVAAGPCSPRWSLMSIMNEEESTFCDVSDYLDIRSLAETMNSINSLLFNGGIPCWLKHKYVRCSSQIKSTVSTIQEVNIPNTTRFNRDEHDHCFGVSLKRDDGVCSIRPLHRPIKTTISHLPFPQLNLH